MPAHRLDRRRLDSHPLEIELEPDAGQSLRAVGQRLVECREIGCNVSQRLEIATAHTAVRRAVAHLAQVVGVREDEGAVGEVEDVELEHVAPELHRERERLQCVLGREGGGATMTDAGEPSFRATQLDQAVRLTTTTAQSSASSPRANARQSSSTTCASSFADRSRRSDSRRSRRSTPYSSPSRRVSMTPSV